MPQAQTQRPAQRAGRQRFALLDTQGKAVFFDVGALPQSSPVTSSVVELACSGYFFREDQGFFQVDRRTLEAMRANAQERGVKIPIKYRHPSIMPKEVAKPGEPVADISDQIAAGWINPKTLVVARKGRDWRLTGRVEWTAAAVPRIKAKEVQYLSPEIQWNSKRSATSQRGRAGESIGPELIAAAFVPEPFFNLAPVEIAEFARRARRYSMLDQGMIDKFKEILGGLGLPEDKLADAVLQLMAAQDAGAEAPAEEPMLEAKDEAAAAPVPPALAASKVAGESEVLKKLEDISKRLGALEAGKTEVFHQAYGKALSLLAGAAPKAPGRLPNASEVASGQSGYTPSPEELKAYSQKHGVGLSKALVALRKAPPATR
jgi:hypothetical protein